MASITVCGSTPFSWAISASDLPSFSAVHSASSSMPIVCTAMAYQSGHSHSLPSGGSPPCWGGAAATLPMNKNTATKANIATLIHFCIPGLIINLL